MSPLNSLTPKMWKMTYYLPYFNYYTDYYVVVGYLRRPYWIFACKKFCPRVTEFGEFEHVFTCVDLSYGEKIAFYLICPTSSRSTERLIWFDTKVLALED